MQKSKNPKNISVNITDNSTKNDEVPKLLTFKETLEKQSYIYIVWIVMIVIIMSIYFFVIGFNTKFTIVLGIILFMFLIVNAILSGLDSINSYNVELPWYTYVESNAQSFLPFGIALAALVIASSKKELILKSEKFLPELLLATCCFVFVLLIVLMPKASGKAIRIARDIKTAVLTLGGITVVALVGEFVIQQMANGKKINF
jgi:hypothetical protein